METNESMQSQEKWNDLRLNADLEETEVEDITMFNDSRRVDPAVFSGLGMQTIKTVHILCRSGIFPKHTEQSLQM